ncbi:PfkB family carbohydrate kinase, partial [Paenibacillus chitinolyticus]
TNREEAELLSGMTISSIEECAEACAKIRERGVKHVIVTMGEQGIYYQSENVSEHLTPYPTEVVDVTGAGDAFVSGLLYGIVNGESFEKACRLGLAASALTLQTEQSVSPSLKADQLERTVEQYEKER